MARHEQLCKPVTGLNASGSPSTMVTVRRPAGLNKHLPNKPRTSTTTKTATNTRKRNQRTASEINMCMASEDLNARGGNSSMVPARRITELKMQCDKTTIKYACRNEPAITKVTDLKPNNKLQLNSQKPHLKPRDRHTHRNHVMFGVK